MASNSDAYIRLRDDILMEKYSDGDHLSEVALANEYDVSRLHIKAALQQLEHEHLVDHYPQRGYFVKGFSDDDITEINMIRKTLTWMAVQPVIDTINEEQLEELRRFSKRIEAFVQSGLIKDTYDEVLAFYQYLYSLTPYKRVSNILNTYNGYILYIIQHSTPTKADNVKGAKYISSLVSAIESRDHELIKEIIDKQDDYKA